MADTKHVKANIQALGEELALLPEVGDEEREVSTREAVRLLLPTIVRMQRKGYRLERIVAQLAERGLVVSASTLRGYLRRAKKPKTSAKPKAGGRQTAAAPVQPAPPPAAIPNSGPNGTTARPEGRSGAGAAPPASSSSARS